MDKNQNVRILNDLPINKDNFGGHNRVAEAIVDLIMNEEGGKSIALTGHWGSGKSSVVEMIKNKLKGKGFVFVFNVWAHEGDPLRRAFLEKMINYLLSFDTKLDKKYWLGKIEELAKRKERTKTTEFKKPTIYAVLLFMITSLLPIGLGILSLWPLISEFFLGLSITLLVLPIVYILFLSLKYWTIKKDDDKKNFLNLLFSEGELQIDSKTSRTIDPTTIEFQNLFIELMDDFSKQIKEEKILIVIDNLDRIDTEDAMKMWSTMRTFFEFENLNNQSWIKNTWLLVPYDFSGLIRLWDNDTIDNFEIEKQNLTHLPLIHSFTEKTFQVSFETPLFIISDAAKYFNKCFKEAFSDNINEEEIHKVYRVFKLQRIPNDLSPTPREIKLFINDLTSTYRQWKNDIPLHLQALYRLLRKSRWCNDRKLIEDLLNNNLEFVDETIRELIDKEYRELLAALFFNTEKNKALQLLLQEPLERALIKNDQEFFNSNQNLPGFSEVCEDIVAKNSLLWAKEEPNTLSLVAKAFSILKIEEDMYISKSWESMITKSFQIKKWSTFNPNSAEGMTALLKRSDNIDFSQAIINSFSESSNLFAENKESKEDKSKTDKDIIEILDGLALLFNSLSELNHQDLIISDFRINSIPTAYIEVCRILGSSNKYKNIYKYFVPIKNTQEIITELIGKITSGLYETAEIYNGAKIIYNNSNLEWAEVIELLNTRLRELSGLKPFEIFYFVKTLYFLRERGEKSDEYLKELTLHGYVPNLFAQIMNTNENEIKALCLIAIIEFAHSGSLTKIVGQANQGISHFNTLMTTPETIPEIIERYSNLIIEFDWAKNIFSEIENKSNIKKFLEAVLTNILERENITEIFDSKIMIENETEIYSCLIEEKYLNLVKKYVSNTALVSQLMEDSFELSMSSLYDAILKSIDEPSNEFIEYLRTGLDSVNKDTWMTEFSQNYINGFDLLITMIKKKKNPDLKSSFVDVLKELIERILKNELNVEELRSKWPQYLYSLDVDHKKTFLGHIRYKIINYNSNLSNLFLLFGDLLYDYSIYDDDINDLVSQGFNNILDRMEGVELNFIKELLANCKEIIKKCSHHYMVSFKDKIERILEDENLEEGKFNTLNEILGLIENS